MAQENFNVSLPNDGLGDALRAAFVKQQAMNTELYGDKVDKVTGKDLSTNDFTNALKAKLDGIENFAEVNVQPNWLQTDVTADDYIKNKPTFNNINDGLVQAGTATIDEVDDTIEFSVGWIVLVGGELAANFTPVTIAVPLATDQRFDVFVMDVTGSIIRVAGVDSETPLIPSAPSGTILLTTVLVTDAEIGTPVIPDLVGFVQKVYFDYSKISLDVENLPADGRTNFTIETPIATFKGFDGSSELYRGKRFIIRNLSGADCELLAGQAVDLPFANTIVLADGQNIEFDVFNNELKRVGSEGGGGGVSVHNDLTGRDATDAHPISSVTNLQTALNGKQAIEEIQTADFTADFDKVYNCRGTFTVTNPTAVLNKSYEIRVLGGAVTIGGEVFQTGSNVHISYNGSTFDYNLRIDIKAVPLTQVAGVITIDASHSYRTVELIVGTTPTTVTISEETKECYFIKNGTATVTFVSDAGRTLIQMNSVNTINTNGSVALVISSGTTDRLFVNDNTNLNFLPLANIKTPVAPVASFSGNPTTATVTFLGPFPSGSNYNVQPEFASFESGWKVTSKTDAGFTFSINQATAPTADVNFLVIKI
jgi:hypothetical protein